VTFRLRFHPPVAHNLDAIAQWIVDHDEPDIEAQKLAEIEGAVATPRDTLHKGSLRSEIAPGMLAIPVGGKAVIAFAVDDETAEVLIFALTYRDAHRASRRTARCH
jgi:plasmid stabilization system protein ParE